MRVIMPSWGNDLRAYLLVANDIHHGSCELPSILWMVRPYLRMDKIPAGVVLRALLTSICRIHVVRRDFVWTPGTGPKLLLGALNSGPPFGRWFVMVLYLVHKDVELEAHTGDHRIYCGFELTRKIGRSPCADLRVKISKKQTPGRVGWLSFQDWTQETGGLGLGFFCEESQCFGIYSKAPGFWKNATWMLGGHLRSGPVVVGLGIGLYEDTNPDPGRIQKIDPPILIE